MSVVSIIVPCYNEQESIPFFKKAIDELSKEISDDRLEIILVDDGSSDDTLKTMKKIAKQDNRYKYISFSRNFGKEAAMFAGLEAAQGEYVAIMDADLQDPPSLLPQMLDGVKSGEYDVMVARRVNRKGEPVIRSMFARLFYRLISKLSSIEIADGARDFRVMNRKYLNAILSLREYNRFSKGLFSWVGFKTKWVEFENVERVAGETKWSFWKLFKYSIEGIVAFTTAPLVISSLLGIIFFLLAIAAMIFIVIKKLAFGDPVPGWASTACIISFFGGIQLLSLGIIGQYLAKMYTEIKNRPIYIVRETNMKEKQ